MTNLEIKTVVYGKAVADRILEIANPRNYVIIDLETSLQTYNLEQPSVAIFDAFDCFSNHKQAVNQCIASRKDGCPIAIMGVLPWDTLRTCGTAPLAAAQLAMFDDLCQGLRLTCAIRYDES